MRLKDNLFSNPFRNPLRNLFECFLWSDFLFALRVCHQVSTPSPLELPELGSGLPSRFRNLGFPEFDRFYKRT